MAKSSISAKKSLKRLFSKSEVDLKESTEKYESSTRSKSLKLFKWKKKRNTNTEDASFATRAESFEAVSREECEEEDRPDAHPPSPKSSIYATVPRSKEGQLSQSETDLRKPKRFPTFNLGWRKKKNSADLSHTHTSVSAVSEEKGSILNQGNELPEEPSQQASHWLVEPEATPTAAPVIHTDQSQVQDGQNDRPRSSVAGSVDIVVPAFTPASMDSASILFIDAASDSDGYQTPPESPGFIQTNTECLVSPEINTKISVITNTTTPETPTTPLATNDFTVKSYSTGEALPQIAAMDFGNTHPVLTPGTVSTADYMSSTFSHISEREPTGADTSQLPPNISSLTSVDASLMKSELQHLNENVAAGAMAHSFALTDLDSQAGGEIKAPLKATTHSTFIIETSDKLMEPAKSQLEPNSTTFSTPAFPQRSLFIPPDQTSSLVPENTIAEMGDFSPTRPADITSVSLHNRGTAFNNPDSCSISNNAAEVIALSDSISRNGFLIPNTESSLSNKERVEPVSLSDPSDEASAASALFHPGPPDVFSFSLDSNSEARLIPAGPTLTGAQTFADMTDSHDPVHFATEQGCHGESVQLKAAPSITSPLLIVTRTFNFEPDDLTESAYTSYIKNTAVPNQEPDRRCSLTSSPVIPELSHSQQETNLVEQASPESSNFTSNRSPDSFKKITRNTLPFRDISATTDVLTICPFTSEQCQSSLPECQETNIGKQIHLQTNKVGGSCEEHQLMVRELISGPQPTAGFKGHSEPVQESWTLTGGLQPGMLTNNGLYDLHSTETVSETHAPAAKVAMHEYEIELSSENYWRGEEYFAKIQQTDTVEIKSEGEKTLESLGLSAEPHTEDRIQKYEKSERENEVVGEELQHFPDSRAPKPDTPVRRARASEECASASPLSPNRDASVTGRSQATRPDLAVGSRPSPPCAWPIIPQEEATVGGAERSAVGLHAVTEGSSAAEHATRAGADRVVSVDTCTLLPVSAGEWESSRSTDFGPPPESHKPVAVETAASRFLHVAEGTLHRAPECEEGQNAGSTKAGATVSTGAHKGAPVHVGKEQQGSLCGSSLCSKNTDSHGAEELSSCPARKTSTPGIIVYIRESALGTEEQDGPPTADGVLPVRPPSSAHSSAERLPLTFPVLSTVTEESESETSIDTVPGSATEMSSGFTLTLRPRVEHDDRDDFKRVRKVSLVGDDSKADIPEPLTTSLENGLTARTEENGASTEDFKAWRSLRKDFHSIPEESESPPPGGSDTVWVNDTHTRSALSSATREPELLPSFSFSPETEQKAPPPAVSLDTASSPGNGSWWNVRSEVQPGSESEAGGRSWAELAAPAGGRGAESEGVITNTGLDSYAQLAESGSEYTDDFFTGVFTATRVELPPSPTDTDPAPAPAPAPAPTSEPHKIPSDMETLVDTLRSMGPPQSRNRTLQRAASLPFSSLPPIREDTPSLAPAPVSSPTLPKETPMGLPPDLGLNWTSMKDMRSPFIMMKEKLGLEGTGRTITLPSRASAISSIVMRKSSLPDLNQEEGAQLNGGSFLGTSRLDNSLLFSAYRADQPDGTTGKASAQRPLYRAASLPDVDQGHERLSRAPTGLDTFGSGATRYDRLALFTSPPHSLTGVTEPPRISRAPLFLHSPPAEGPVLNSPPSSLLPESPMKYPAPPSLQRSLNSEGSPGSSAQETMLEKQFVAKYRAFPDAYRTKEKEHGKLNPRPGKMLIFDEPGLRGQCIEVRSDVMDTTAWKLPETISIRVVRGGWVLYEKPEFKGQKIALDEGDIELTNPFGSQDNGQRPTQNGTGESGEDGPDPEPNETKTFIIGSLRRAVRDYSVPEICLFPEEDAGGKKVIFRDTSEDARIYGFPIRANSIIINAGLWLVFSEPFFQGVPRVLEVGGFPKPKSWCDTEPYVSSLHPLKIGEPRVEKPNEPKLVIYEKPYFTGKKREIYTNARDFITIESRQQTAIMYCAGSVKVIGGIWVGYEKEGFRGHQYLLEEGEYHDWRVWGGCDCELRSARVIRTDLIEPMLMMIEMPNEEEDENEDEERTLEATEAVADVELSGFRPAVRSIKVLSGVWVAYSHVDYSGNQYVLEKGYYNTCIDWGAEDNRICSIQPVLKAPSVGPVVHSELLLYSEPGFQGLCQEFTKSHESLPSPPSVQSCRVLSGSWVLYDTADFTGNQYVLSEGDYVNLTSMGCPSGCVIRSVKSVPTLFAVPSISLFGLECFEGREVTLDTEVSDLMTEGFNPHFLSVRVNTGCWVLYEHTNYRGRQFLLEPVEVTNWHKFSSLSSIGSIYPIRPKQRFFRIRYKESGYFMSVQGGVDQLKSGRVVVSEHVEGTSDIWFYQNGLIKNKLAPTMSLQVIGNVESGAKVVLWSETRTPVQMWSTKLTGAISSLTFPGMVLIVKGGNMYDKEHVIVYQEAEENAKELWEVEFI
ncbi:uncharacterized protein crybg2 [Brachyhypopomus gauderio]|uniref:uncharacterized protein crybg2 n=1 Tax=Brachyhypopomus gauderio TaxID=698409 RepID=UPI0040423F37